jgi:hypothetical protein
MSPARPAALHEMSFGEQVELHVHMTNSMGITIKHSDKQSTRRRLHVQEAHPPI